MKPKGHLYLIPTTLGEQPASVVLPQPVRELVLAIDYYVVENEKTARRFIKNIAPEKPQPSLRLAVLNKRTDLSLCKQLLEPCLAGIHQGLLSEAGCPAIADPGADLVKIAHELGIRVIPMVGPSSILLAMMASGLNGQCFTFNGYLPIDKAEKRVALKRLEKMAAEKSQAQIFIETPYRNNKLLEDILQALLPSTLLCIAADITLPTELIKTLSVADWKKQTIDLQNRPCIFILQGV